jgi:hypothetical protein
MYEEVVFDSICRLDEAISTHGHYHRHTMSCQQALSKQIMSKIGTVTNNNKMLLCNLLWKHCQYGPIDARRRLSQTASGGNFDDDFVRTAIIEAIGMQVILMSNLGGLHNIILSHLGLPCSSTSKQCSTSEDIQLFTVNTVHLGDLFRYLASKDTPSNHSKWTGTAISCYQSVTKLDPGCGLAWNQLGVMSAMNITADTNNGDSLEGIDGKSKHILESVYYHVMALTTAKPFEAALQNVRSVLKRVKGGGEHNEIVNLAIQYFVDGHVSSHEPDTVPNTSEEQVILDYVFRNSQ